MAYIFISKPDGSKNKYRLPNNESTRVDIGRSDDCLISLPDVIGVSGLHCCIGFSNGHYFIKDENSSNGTIVDDRSITQEPLYEDKSYHIGEAILTFFGEGAVAPPPAASAKSNLGSEDGKTKASNNTTAPSRKYARSSQAKLSDKLFPVYVIVVCIVAFLAGVTLRHWKETGQYDPTPFTQEEAAATKTTKATKAPAKEASDNAKPKAEPKKAAPAEVAPAPVEEPKLLEEDESLSDDGELSDEGEEGSL